MPNPGQPTEVRPTHERLSRAAASTLDGLGIFLASERAARSVTLEELAQMTRIPLRLLQALEQGHWSALPGEVFVRGYLRTIAKVLGIREAELLCRYTEGRSPSTPPPLPVSLGRHSQPRQQVGFAVALVVLVVLFTFALSMITEPRYRTSPVRLSAVVSAQANIG